jgi:hypothetical protein
MTPDPKRLEMPERVWVYPSGDMLLVVGRGVPPDDYDSNYTRSDLYDAVVRERDDARDLALRWETLAEEALDAWDSSEMGIEITRAFDAIRKALSPEKP